MSAHPPSQRVRRVLGVVAASGLILAACGADGPDVGANSAPDPTLAPVTPAEPSGATDTTVASNGEIVEVIALDNSFRAETIEVTAGTAVRWENRGRNDHNVLPTDDAAVWGAATEDFKPGAEYTWVFAEPGTYAYHCSIHGTKDAGMIGTVVVVPAS